VCCRVLQCVCERRHINPRMRMQLAKGPCKKSKFFFPCDAHFSSAIIYKKIHPQKLWEIASFSPPFWLGEDYFLWTVSVRHGPVWLVGYHFGQAGTILTGRGPFLWAKWSQTQFTQQNGPRHNLHIKMVPAPFSERKGAFPFAYQCPLGWH